MTKRILFFIFILLLSLKGFSQKKDTRDSDFQYKLYYLEAEKQKALGNYKSALTNYQQAKNVYPENPAPYYDIALILLANNDPFAASEYANNAVKLDKNQNTFYLQTLLSCQMMTNKIDDAIKSNIKLIKIDHRNLLYYTNLAAIYESKKEYKNAIKILDEAERVFGVNESFSMAKESYYYLLKKEKKAIAEIKKLLASNPNNNKYKAIMGESYLLIGDTTNAEKYFNEVESAENIDGQICLALANYYQTKNDEKKYFIFLTNAFFDEELDIEIKYDILFKCLNNEAFVQKYKKEMGVLIDKVLIDFPDNISFTAIAIDYYIAVADYKNAQKEMENLLSKDKDKYQVWEQLIITDFFLSDYQKMYEHSNEAISLFPNYLKLYKYFVTAAYSIKKYNELIDAVEYASVLAISEKETLIELLSIQGDAYANLEKYHKSDSVFELALTKDPENLIIMNNYSYSLSERNEKLDRALELSSRLIELEKNNPVYLDTYAWVLYKCQKYEDALFLIEKAILLDSENSVYFDHKGDILFKLNKINMAIESWLKARELGDDSELLNNKINIKNLTD